MGHNICYHCMHDMGKGTICPACGHINAETAAKQPKYALPCGFLLRERYSIGRVLGQGGFGITYMGFDVMLQSRVCIKEYYPAGSAIRDGSTSSCVTWTLGIRPEFSQAGKQSFVNEARKAVKLRDMPSVVKVWDIFYENETAYIVMEFVDGVTLKDHLIAKGAPMTLKDCYDALLPMLRDLQTVHDLGVIHRDISPDNVMLRKGGGLVLLDLGAAKDLTVQNTEASMLVARKGFSPLEQYIQNGNIGPWTDVYALTATIYYCMTGHAPVGPMERSSGVELNTQGMPPALAALFQRGLALQVKDRFKSMDELRTAMESILYGYRSVTAQVRPIQPSAQVQPMQPPAQPPVQAPQQPPIKQPTKPPVQQSAKPPVQAPQQPPVQAPMQSSVQRFTPEDQPPEDAPEASGGPNLKRATALLFVLAGVAALVTLAIGLAGRSSEEEPAQIAPAKTYSGYAVVQATLPPENTPKPTVKATALPTPKPRRRPRLGEGGISIAAGDGHVAAVRRNGTVNAAGSNDLGQCGVGDWTDIVAVAAGSSHTVGLKSDGTVVATRGKDWRGNSGYRNYGQSDVSGWKNIVAVAAGSLHTLGLKADGTVVAVGGSDHGRLGVTGWRDIVAIAAGGTHSVGLNADGTVVAAGNDAKGQCDVYGWTDIVAIAAGDSHTVGLRANGTVVAVGNNSDGQCNVSSWRNIVAIAAGKFHTVGLKADGTVVAVGADAYGELDVTWWADVVAVAAGDSVTVGLRSNGSVVTVGNNRQGQGNVSGWTNIRVPQQ